MSHAKASHKRILLKISGEIFGSGGSFDLHKSQQIVREIVDLSKSVQFAIVIGGGNLLRGAELHQEYKLPKASCDYMGMMATTINAIFLRELFVRENASAVIITARAIDGIGEVYHRQRCQEFLAQGKIILFAGGTGHPYFTTDTAAALRAVEIGADCFFKATKEDGVFDDDPKKNPQAKKIDSLTYEKFLSEKYRVMDLTAVTFCMENRLPIRVFNFNIPNNFAKAVQGEDIGTLISENSFNS